MKQSSVLIFIFFDKLQFNKKQKQDYKGGYPSLHTVAKSAGRISLKYKKEEPERKEHLAATWAAELQVLLTQEKEKEAKH